MVPSERSAVSLNGLPPPSSVSLSLRAEHAKQSGAERVGGAAAANKWRAQRIHKDKGGQWKRARLKRTTTTTEDGCGSD